MAAETLFILCASHFPPFFLGVKSKSLEDSFDEKLRAGNKA